MQDVFLRRILIALGVACVLGTGVLALAMTVTFEPYGVPELRKEEYLQLVDDLKSKREAIRTRGKVAAPIAFVTDDTFDFGLMDPLTKKTHSFEVRNDGDLDLILTGGETTCKCTLLKGEKQVIKPGETSEVELIWNSGKKRESYEQTAKIRTNDPLHRVLKFKIKGRVRYELATSEEEVYFTNLTPGGEATRTLEVYSQLFHDFEIQKIDSTLDALVWEVEPMSSEQLSKHEARCGYTVDLRLPLDAIDSYFNGVVRLHVLPDREPESMTEEEIIASLDRPEPDGERETEVKNEPILKEIPLRGKVPGRLTVVGAGLRVDEGFDFGVLTHGQRHERNLFVRVRGDRKPQQMEVRTVAPDFVHVEITPTSRPQLYKLTLVIPEDAPKAIFNTAGTKGRLDIANDLMADGMLTLPLYGAIIDPK